MHKDTKNSYLPLLWELSVPDNIRDLAEVAGDHDNPTFREGTLEYAYLHTLSALTSVMRKYVELVNVDDSTVTIYVRNRFSAGDFRTVSRLFDTRMYTPDAVLNDLLYTSQAVLSIRSAGVCSAGPELIETQFTKLERVDTPVDCSDLKYALSDNAVSKLNSSVLVYHLREIRESVYDGHYMDRLPVTLVGKTGISRIDSLHMSIEMERKPFMLNSAITKAETYFKRTKYRAR